MCYMIAVGLPPKFQQKWLDALPARMNFWTARYKGLSEEMNGFAVVIIGTSMCSCDLFRSFSQDNAEARYRRKGWSKNKIARALQNRENAKTQSGLAGDFRLWLAAAADDCREAYCFIHWDSDALEYDRRVSVSSSQLRESSFAFEEEILIHVKSIYNELPEAIS